MRAVQANRSLAPTDRHHFPALLSPLSPLGFPLLPALPLLALCSFISSVSSLINLTAANLGRSSSAIIGMSAFVNGFPPVQDGAHVSSSFPPPPPPVARFLSSCSVADTPISARKRRQVMHKMWDLQERKEGEERSAAESKQRIIGKKTKKAKTAVRWHSGRWVCETKRLEAIGGRGRMRGRDRQRERDGERKEEGDKTSASTGKHKNGDLGILRGSAASSRISYPSCAQRGAHDEGYSVDVCPTSVPGQTVSLEVQQVPTLHTP
eukprot:1514364-Rhodomonas_salina.1